MIIKKIFFDANIFNDIFDTNREAHNFSKKAFSILLNLNFKAYTSCDIATNIYYITAKYTTTENTLNAIESVKEMVNIIPFGEDELSSAIKIMRKDSDYKDFEDTIQYILAKNSKCDIIVSNDKKFVSKEIEIMTSKIFVEKFDF